MQSLLPKSIKSYLDEVLSGPPLEMQRLKDIARHRGLSVNPVGNQNRKTGVPSTYRPVGDSNLGGSCPKTCQYLDAGCYAQDGFINVKQHHAVYDLIPSLSAAAIGMVYGNWNNQPCRLHASGDFMKGASVDHLYVKGLIEIAQTIQARRGVAGPFAWSYTHIRPAQFENYREQLAEAGIIVLYSDILMAGGSIVYQHKQVDALRAHFPDVKLAKCPAQLVDDYSVTCATCRVCWRAAELNVCVVFDPHGKGKKQLPILREVAYA